MFNKLPPLSGPVDASGEPWESVEDWIVREARAISGPRTHLQDSEALIQFGLRVARRLALPSSSPVADSPTDLEMFDWLEMALYGKTGNTWEIDRMDKVRDVLRKIRASAPSASAGAAQEKEPNGDR